MPELWREPPAGQRGEGASVPGPEPERDAMQCGDRLDFPLPLSLCVLGFCCWASTLIRYFAAAGRAGRGTHCCFVGLGGVLA